jgi:hypothetical protein
MTAKGYWIYLKFPTFLYPESLESWSNTPTIVLVLVQRVRCALVPKSCPITRYRFNNVQCRQGSWRTKSVWIHCILNTGTLNYQPCFRPYTTQRNTVKCRREAKASGEQIIPCFCSFASLGRSCSGVQRTSCC